MDQNAQNYTESENPQGYQSSTTEIQSINTQKPTPPRNSTKLIIILGLILLLLIIGGGLWYSQTVHKSSLENSTTPTISTNIKETKPTPTLRKNKAPDLTTIANKLTSSDPKIQQQALAPGGNSLSNQPVLPVGSSLTLEPNTWASTGLDSTGAPASGN